MRLCEKVDWINMVTDGVQVAGFSEYSSTSIPSFSVKCGEFFEYLSDC